MKKVLIAMGMMLAATFTLTNCAQDELLAPDKAGSSVKSKLSKIVVTSESTKLVNDGLKTKWVAGDPASLFHIATGDTVFVSDGKWVADTDGYTTNFTGNFNLDAGFDSTAFYDWYLFYPYRSGLASPRGEGLSNPFWFGSRVEVQYGMNQRGHLIGNKSNTGSPEYFPVVGRASAVPGRDVPEIYMKNICSALEINVKNTTSSPLRIFSVEFIAPEGSAIAGTQTLDMTGEAPAFAPVTAYDAVRLNVDFDQMLMPDATASYYMAFKPFTAAAGQTIAIRVNGYEKTMVLTEDLDFASGHIRPVAFSYDNQSAADYSGSYFIAGEDPNGAVWAAISETALPREYDGSNGTNPVLFTHKIKVDGGKVYYDENMSVIGTETIEDYKYNITRVAEGAYAGMYTIQRAFDDRYLCPDLSTTGNRVQFVDVLSSDCYFDIFPDGNTGKYYLVATLSGTSVGVTPPTTHRRLNFNYSNGNYPRFTFFPEVDNYEGSFLIPFGEPEVDPMPRFGSISDIVLPATGAVDEQIDVVIENNDSNGWSLAVDSFTGCVTAAETGFGDAITFSTVANTDTAGVLTGSIVLALVDPNDENNKVTATVNITLTERPTHFWVRVAEDKVNWTGEYILVHEGEGGASGHVVSTDASYADKNAGFAVYITPDGIGATADIKARGLVTVKKWDGNGGSQYPVTYPGGAYEKSYILFKQNGDGIGRYANASFAFNANASYSRFSWDLNADGELRSYGNAARGAGTLKYSTALGIFGILLDNESDTTVSADTCEKVYLYEYR